MELNNILTIAAHPVSPNQNTEPVAPQKRTPRNGKLPKIRRGENSFRPGQVMKTATPTAPLRPKELHFLIPSSGTLGSTEEAGQVLQMAAQLDSNFADGKVINVNISNSMWQMVLSLSHQDVQDEDAFLSEVFRKLMPTLDTLPGLKTGFIAGNYSRWEYRIGSFVADQGGF